MGFQRPYAHTIPEVPSDCSSIANQTDGSNVNPVKPPEREEMVRQTKSFDVYEIDAEEPLEEEIEEAFQVVDLTKVPKQFQGKIKQ